jgi:hypothetical protein
LGLTEVGRAVAARTQVSGNRLATGGDGSPFVEHLVARLRARISLPIATAAARCVATTRLAITLIAPLRNEHAAAAWAFAAAVLWAGLAHDALR